MIERLHICHILIGELSSKYMHLRFFLIFTSPSSFYKQSSLLWCRVVIADSKKILLRLWGKLQSIRFELRYCNNMNSRASSLATQTKRAPTSQTHHHLNPK